MDLFRVEHRIYEFEGEGVDGLEVGVGRMNKRVLWGL